MFFTLGIIICIKFCHNITLLIHGSSVIIIVTKTVFYRCKLNMKQMTMHILFT